MTDSALEGSDAALASFAGNGITLDIHLPADILIDGEVPEAAGLDQADVLRLNCGLDCTLTINGANLRFQQLLHGPKNSVIFFVSIPADVRFLGKPLDEEARQKESPDVTLFSAFPTDETP